MKRIKAIAVLVMISLIVFSCINPIWAATTATLQFSPNSTDSLSIGETFSATLTAQNLTDTTVEIDLPDQIQFINSNSSDATVTQDGSHLLISWPDPLPTDSSVTLNFQATQAGDFTIQAHSGESTAACTVKVNPAQDPPAASPESEPPSQPASNNTVTQNTDDSLQAEGWTEQSKIGYSTIPLTDTTSLRYQFGGIGAVDTRVSLVNLMVNYSPNVYFVNNGDKIYSLWGSQNETSTSGVFFSNAKGAYTALIDEDNFRNPHYYTKEEANGLTAQKLTFDFSLYGEPTTIAFEMYGREDGTILVTESLTNNGNAPISNFSMLNLNDTDFNGNDGVPIHYIGDNNGLYIESGHYQLNYFFNLPNSYPNWSGGNFYTYQNPFEAGFPAGNHFDQPGQEINNGAAGSLAVRTLDSAIYSKTMPISIAPQETATFDYVVSIENTLTPKLVLDQATAKGQTIAYYGDDFTISGTWSDSDSETMDLYYKVDDQNAVLFADNANKTDTKTPYQHAIPSSQIITGAPELGKEHTIQVYAVDPDGNQSTISQAVLKESTCEVTANYVDTDGNVIHAPITKSGRPEESYQTDQLVIDGYTLDHVEGASSGTFSDAPVTVTYVYQADPFTAALNVTKADGSSADTALPGDSLHYEVVLSPPFKEENNTNYQTATMTLAIDPHLTDLKNISLTDGSNQPIGNGQYDDQQHTLQAALDTADIPHNQALKLSFDATIDADTAPQTIIKETAQISGSLTDQKNFTVTSNEVATTITEGSLSIVSAPDEIVFGEEASQMIPQKTTDYMGRTIDSPLIIQDSRSAGHTWTMTVRLATPLEGTDRHDKLDNGLSYYHDGTQYMITETTAAPVMSGTSATHDPVDVSTNWTAHHEGLELTVKSQQPYAETYEGTLSWALQDAP